MKSVSYRQLEKNSNNNNILRKVHDDNKKKKLKSLLNITGKHIILERSDNISEQSYLWSPNIGVKFLEGNVVLSR